jgi:arylsulfatase A-like enzyme
MTGCYPRRINLHVGGTGQSVLMPVDPKGLHPNEVTIARLLKERGYATSCVGKWHLGDQIPFLPTRHGFDEFFGCPYSEDMAPYAWAPLRPPLPLMRNEEVIEAPMDRHTLTRRYTEEGIRFIREHKDEPFFLYLAHAMPGSTPRPFAGRPFQGKSANGPYGDAVEELDWSYGEILRCLEEMNLDEKTLVIWASDNGAVGWVPPQGSNLPLKGWGYETSEGGQRVPCIARWPGTVPAGVVTDSVCTMMDILPTAAGLSTATLPSDRSIDGFDRTSLLTGTLDENSPYDERGFFYYHMHQLQCVRSGPWKLYLPLQHKLRELQEVSMKDCDPSLLRLYDVRNDIGETRELSDEHPEIVNRLLGLAEAARADIGDWGRQGADQRPAGWVENPKPRLK